MDISHQTKWTSVITPSGFQSLHHVELVITPSRLQSTPQLQSSYHVSFSHYTKWTSVSPQDRLQSPQKVDFKWHGLQSQQQVDLITTPTGLQSSHQKGLRHQIKWTSVIKPSVFQAPHQVGCTFCRLQSSDELRFALCGLQSSHHNNNDR